MNPEDLVGKTLGQQYRLRNLLGKGGMGCVYRADQIALARIVAVKVMSPRLVSDTRAIQRFQREAQTAAKLGQAHIIPVHDYGMQDDISYLVMRYLDGGSLWDRLQQRADMGQPLPTIREIAGLLDQLASALDYAHQQGVIHRDIKPNNVMFDNQGCAYLVDFGIAKLLEGTSDLTTTGVLMGTPSFMAPELWRDGPITPAVDQYALGAMIYVLLTGEAPFQANTPYALMHKHLYEIPTPPHVYRAEIPDAITPVLKRAMAKNPAERFPTITAFAQSFSGAISGETGECTNFFTAPIQITRKHTSYPEAGKLELASTAVDQPNVEKPRGAGASLLPIRRRWLVLLPVGLIAGALVLMIALNSSRQPSAMPLFPTNTLQSASSAVSASNQPPDLTGMASQWTYTPAHPVVTPNLQQTLDVMVAYTETALASSAPTDTLPPPLASVEPVMPSSTITPAQIALAKLPAQVVIAPDNIAQLAEWASIPVGSQAIKLAFSPDSRQLAVGAASVVIYDAQTLHKMLDIGGDSRMAFDAGWTLLATIEDKSVGLWNPANGGKIGTIDVMTAIQDIAVSPDGQSVAAASGKTLKILDVTSRRVVKTLPVDTFMQGSAVAFSPDGALLAAAADKGVTLWDTATWSPQRTLDGAAVEIAFSPNGNRLAAIQHDKILVWEVPGGKQVVALKSQLSQQEMNHALAFSPDGRLLASGSDDTIVRIWEVNTGRQLITLAGHTEPIRSVLFSPNGTTLASSSVDATVRLWGIPAN